MLFIIEVTRVNSIGISALNLIDNKIYFLKELNLWHISIEFNGNNGVGGMECILDIVLLYIERTLMFITTNLYLLLSTHKTLNIC